MATRVKKPKVVDKFANKEYRYDKLRVLIREFADAKVADSWKGGGDPADIEVMELNLKLRTALLMAHIEKMERYDG